ncbi:MAG: hypothetical protein DMG68_04030 [Acidobacteria bacterium]|nr:MAG: hypothetical protein DMG68_04030 [Acidobacteriota bacterium]
MRRIALTSLAIVITLAAFAHAEEWKKSFNISGKPSLKVETSDANIQVDTWDQNTIEARVTTEGYKIGEGGIRVIDRQNGDTVELEVRYPHRYFSFEVGNHHHVDIEIRMPKEGRVDLHTGDGKIQLTHFKGDMDLNSADGHQDIDSVEGNLHAHAGDGQIRAAGRFDGLDVSTGDGRIEVMARSGSALTRSWTLQTGDGAVTLQVPQNLAADIDLHTGDGHINLDMPISVEGRLSERNIRGKLNGGGNLLTIHTGDGSIRLEKS